MKEENKKTTKKKRTKTATTTKVAEKPKLPIGIEAQDWEYLQLYSRYLTRIRTTAVVSGASAGEMSKLWNIYKKYNPQDKGNLGMGCNSCVFKSLIRVAKWKLKLDEQIK